MNREYLDCMVENVIPVLLNNLKSSFVFSWLFFILYEKPSLSQHRLHLLFSLLFFKGNFMQHNTLCYWLLRSWLNYWIKIDVSLHWSLWQSMGVHLNSLLAFISVTWWWHGFNIFKRLSLRVRRRRLKAPLLPSQNALGGISYSSLFWLSGKKSPKVDTQALFWCKFPFSKTSPQILVLRGGGGRKQIGYCLNDPIQKQTPIKSKSVREECLPTPIH
jgi:hypothetical protein